MSRLILPPIVDYNERRARLAERHEALKWFDRELKELDPYLELIKASESSDEPDLIPGYWHIRRQNPVGIQTYIAITGPAGEFMEPHSGVIEDLRRMDLQRPGAWEEFHRNLSEKESAASRAAEEQREEFREEFMERYRHHNGTSARIKK